MATPTETMSEKQQNNLASAMHHEGQEFLRANLKTTPRMIAFVSVIAWSAITLQFDLTYGGTVLQMNGFLQSFGTCTMVPNAATGVSQQVCKLSANAQAILAISSLTMALGSLFSSIPGHYIGRKGTIWFGCALMIVGAAGQCGTSGSYAAYNVCKCITTFGIGQHIAVAFLYSVECVAPQTRGATVSLITVGLTFGHVICSSVCAGTSKIPNDWAWRTLVILQIPFAIIYAVAIAFFPESPRWLLLKGKHEQARRSFGWYYNQDPQSDAITAQVCEVQTYIEFEKDLATTTSWTELFHRKYVRRTLISAFVSANQGLSGVSFVGNYFVVFLVATGVSNPFVISIYLAICGFVGSCLGPLIVEAGGRRFANLTGFGIMSACMLIFSAVASGVGASTDTAKNTLIAFLCLWYFVFAACVAPSTWLQAAELHNVRLRTYGQAFSMFWANLFSFATALWTPYMINPTAGNMGTNVGYFYCGLNFAIFAINLFILPETARLSLEQIDDYFESGRKAWKTSLGRNKKIASGQIFDVAPEIHTQAQKEADATLKETNASST